MTRSNLRAWFAFSALTSLAVFLGCSGPPVATTLTGEPVCADYSIGTGGQKLRGGLRFPVRVTVLKGDDPVTKVIVFGKRNEEIPSPKVVLPDKDREYKVEWAQCANEHATPPVTATKSKSLRSDGLTVYDCGEAKPYKTTTLVTAKGKPETHALAFEAPPNAECWMNTMPDAVADAGAPDAEPVADVPDAGDADAEVSDAGMADAEASDAATAADAAAVKEGGDKPAEKKADKPAK